MTNTDTADVAATVAQVAALARAGSELVRVTVNNEDAAAGGPRIVEGLDRLGVAGADHRGLPLQRPPAADPVSRLRRRAGQVPDQSRQRRRQAADEHFRAIIEVALAHGKPVRIGVNWGSLDQAC